MFFRTVIALTLSLAIIGIPQIGFADEPDLEIEQIDLYPDEMKSYQRSFIVTSVFYSPKRPASIILPEMIWPTDVKEISSDYGWRPKPCRLCSSDHKGIDLIPGAGEPVYAAMDGIVSWVEYDGSFGMHVYIDHIAVINDKVEKWQTIYAHLQKESVPEDIFVGSLVEAGAVVGAVGNTGISTAPHLHFEILVEGENVDPEKYLLMYTNR